MRNPGRTASTAAALMIGIALVTFVSVLGSGLKDTTTGSVHDSVKAQYVVAGSDGWSPIATKIPAQVAAVDGVDLGDDRRARTTRRSAPTRSPSPASTPRRSPRASGSTGSRATTAWCPRWAVTARSSSRTSPSTSDLEIGERFNVTTRSGGHLSLVVRGTTKSSFFNPLGMGELTVSDATFKSRLRHAQAADDARQRHSRGAGRRSTRRSPPTPTSRSRRPRSSATTPRRRSTACWRSSTCCSPWRSSSACSAS